MRDRHRLPMETQGKRGREQSGWQAAHVSDDHYLRLAMVPTSTIDWTLAAFACACAWDGYERGVVCGKGRRWADHSKVLERKSVIKAVTVAKIRTNKASFQAKSAPLCTTRQKPMKTVINPKVSSAGPQLGTRDFRVSSCEPLRFLRCVARCFVTSLFPTLSPQGERA